MEGTDRNVAYIRGTYFFGGKYLFSTEAITT